MQSSYSAEMKQSGICMEERSVNSKCVVTEERSIKVNKNHELEHSMNGTVCI